MDIIMKKAAAIDIGTNSMRLLLCEIDNNRIEKKNKELITTRIGQDVSKSGMLSEKAIVRNIDALKYFVNKAKDFEAESIAVIATSAVRDAKNREEFLKRAKTETGIDIMIIEGTEEAELGIIGVMSGLAVNKDDILVIDIGGGSTELVLGNMEGIDYSISVNAGAVRMTENFIKENPISKADIDELHESLHNLFNNTIKALAAKNVSKAVAIGGTATSLAAIFHSLKTYKSEIVHNSILSIDFLRKTFENIKNMTISERYEINGLQKERADVIPAGLYILIYLLSELRLDEVIISEDDNLEGAVMKYILK